MGSSRFVDLGLSSHRIKRKVHDDFKYALLCTYRYLVTSLVLLCRLVVIAEKEKVYLHEEFPTPLINRLEKHFLVMSTILTSFKESTLVRKCLEWVQKFSDCYHNGYK